MESGLISWGCWDGVTTGSGSDMSDGAPTASRWEGPSGCCWRSSVKAAARENAPLINLSSHYEHRMYRNDLAYTSPSTTLLITRCSLITGDQESIQ